MTAISTARKEQPDLIVLDLGIPAGDSFVVLQRLAMLINTGTIPVIVLSSRTHIAALKAGAIAYIHKPVDVPVLLKAINDALGISATDAPPQPPPPPPQSCFRAPHDAPLTCHFLR